MTIQPPLTAADLDWLAFRYVTGDLPDAERDAWEVRLADDQAAREAVARAVELAQAMLAPAAAEMVMGRTELAASAQRRNQAAVAGGRVSMGSRPLAWMAVGAAACLALVFAAGWRPEGAPREPLTPARGLDVASARLAAAWLVSRQSDDVLIDEAEFPVLADPLALPTDPAADAEWSHEPMRAPSWMVAALAKAHPPHDDAPWTDAPWTETEEATP